MIDYIVFEKKADEHLPAWSLDLVKDFCEDQKHEVASYEDSAVFIVAKLVSATDDCEKKYRHLELTPTVSFLIRDDPSLDEFLQPEIPEIQIPKDHPMAYPQIHTLTIEEVGDSKEEEPVFSYF
jgi:hypothetical protein